MNPPVPNDLSTLAVLIRERRESLLSRWRAQVCRLPSARDLNVPALNDHIPALLDALADAFQSGADETIRKGLGDGSPPAHGLQRVEDGFDIREVVAEYNILRECLHELACENGLTLQGKPFRIINGVLDNAIGEAVQAFATHQALEVQHRREEYLTFVAHDLRTPLNAITLAVRVLELILPPQGTTSETAQMLKSLRRNSQHLAGLVAKVLEENAHLQTELGIKLQRREFDLWPLVEGLIHDLHPVAGTSSTRLVNRVPDDLVVYADADLLRRVFQNLIANAIKYTPSGEVVIGARYVDDGGTKDQATPNATADVPATHGSRLPVECWVTDNGAGIPKSFLEKVFEKGETDPDGEGGVGLGLAIVKTFVEAHGGIVVAESRPGHGSTFRFSLSSNAKKTHETDTSPKT